MPALPAAAWLAHSPHLCGLFFPLRLRRGLHPAPHMSRSPQQHHCRLPAASSSQPQLPHAACTHRLPASTRALVRHIPSLSLCCCRDGGQGVNLHMTKLPLHELRCPVDASRFLFSSLSSLYVCFWHCSKDNLLSLFSLLETMPDCLSSLRRFHFRETRAQSDAFDAGELPFTSPSSPR